MLTSVNEVCVRISQQPKPLLFFDTCTLLNVINSLHNKNMSTDGVGHAIELMKLHGNEEVWLITAENVREEFNDNIDNVVGTAKQEIKKTSRNIEVMLSVCNQTISTTFSPPDLPSFNIEILAKNASEQLLRSCLIVQREDDYAVRAMNRVRGNIAPAKQGREAKDCEIIECFLDLSSKLRARNYNEKIIFITANTKDYGERRVLRPPLDEDFLAVQAEYVNGLNHAVHLCSPVHTDN